jgi:aspartate/methionine/tyrosine aminotransferase
MTLAQRLIREHKVATVPGSAFGLPGTYLRISYGALAAETVDEGMERLVRGIKEIVSE